ncbi:MAG: glycosyltransferase [Phycisphaerae bacterium]|nr:glycosyltransferase [Phycisphaerae bacterium]
MDATKAPLRMIYFVGEGIFSAIVDSQVIVPLNVIGRAAPDIRRALLILTSIRHRTNPDVPAREKAIRQTLPGAQVLFKYRTILNVPFQHRLWAGKLRAALSECGYDGDDPIIVHCRAGETAAAAALLKRHDPRLRLLVDMRGDPIDEVSRRGVLSWYLRYWFMRTQRAALDGADGLNTVSHRLAEHLRQVGLLKRDLPRSVIGCCVDTERFYYDPALRAQRREEFGLADKFVVCYCGSMARYQRPDAIAEAFAALRNGMPDAHLLAVTREAQALLDHLERLGVGSEHITVRAAAHDQVASYLMAGDVGMLLREDVITNHVASPVKFAEYLRCGLPVILTPYIGDLPALVAREKVGQTVSFPVRAAEVLQAAQAIRARHESSGDEYRQHCSRVAAEQLSWSGQIGKLIELYRTLASS